jgi:hypothetical protein
MGASGSIVITITHEVLNCCSQQFLTPHCSPRPPLKNRPTPLTTRHLATYAFLTCWQHPSCCSVTCLVYLLQQQSPSNTSPNEQQQRDAYPTCKAAGYSSTHQAAPVTPIPASQKEHNARKQATTLTAGMLLPAHLAWQWRAPAPHQQPCFPPHHSHQLPRHRLTQHPQLQHSMAEEAQSPHHALHQCIAVEQ